MEKDAKKGSNKKRELFVPPLPKGKTIFHQWVEEKLILDKLPKDKAHKLCKIVSKQVVDLCGPFNEELPPSKNFAHAFGSSFSLYPFYKGNSSREGDPICDSYRLQIHNNATLFCLADGCNWGERPRQASNRAKDAFIAYLMQKIHEFKTARDIAPHLVNALACGHISIIHDKEDIWSAGTTTILGGVLVKNDVKADEPQTWTLLGISVGDCKIFHWVAAEKKVYDITATNRQEVEDAKDPGGRIGPYVDDGDPDLRNLDVLYQICHTGDVIIIVSDGVHDNLDPVTLGRTPAELGLEGNTHADWKKLDRVKRNVAKEKFMTDMLESLIKKCPHPTPLLICKQIIRHVRNITEAGRVFMEQNPNAGMAGLSYTEYPGKMDHTTCVAFKVREYDPSFQEEGDNVQSLDPNVLRF